jgi:hypothetical protein
MWICKKKIEFIEEKKVKGRINEEKTNRYVEALWSSG